MHQQPDEWRLKVKYVSDLQAAVEVYHHVCSVKFRTETHIRRKFLDENSSWEHVISATTRISVDRSLYRNGRTSSAIR